MRTMEGDVEEDNGRRSLWILPSLDLSNLLPFLHMLSPFLHMPSPFLHMPSPFFHVPVPTDPRSNGYASLRGHDSSRGVPQLQLCRVAKGEEATSRVVSQGKHRSSLHELHSIACKR